MRDFPFAYVLAKFFIKSRSSCDRILYGETFSSVIKLFGERLQIRRQPESVEGKCNVAELSDFCTAKRSTSNPNLSGQWMMNGCFVSTNEKAKDYSNVIKDV